MNPHGITHEAAPTVLKPLCANRIAMFDSLDPNVSAYARSLCDACPLLTSCREERDDWLGASTTNRAQVTGTWAGRTYGDATSEEQKRDRRRRAAAKASATRAEKAATEPPRTHCIEGHPFDEANTYINPTTGRRQCKTCRRKSSARHRARKSAA